MTCKACIERGKPEIFGSDPICAFDGDFSDNWQCATLNLLRDALEDRKELVYGGDQRMISINLWDENSKVDFNIIEDQPVCLFATWYKRRGRTEQVWLLFDDREPRRPTEAELLHLIQVLEA